MGIAFPPEPQNFEKSVDSQSESSQDTQNMLKVFQAILELQSQKAAVYGRSYCRHGDLSIFMNVERKWDRISNIMEKAMKNGTETLYQTGTPTETFVDTIVDLASYSLLWVGYIAENRPEAFQKFLESNNLTCTCIQPENFKQSKYRIKISPNPPIEVVDSSNNR